MLEFWEDQAIFYKTLQQTQSNKRFVFYDGPPGTNGLPHVGHIMQSALKDLWPRYKTMQGYYVMRKAGWDTHGLPVEQTSERELALADKKAIRDYGIESFINYCRETVFRYKDKWVYAIKRIGRFLDFDQEYATLTNDYIQTDWWILKQAWEKGLLYKDYRIVPFCPTCESPLSNHERDQGYQTIKELSIYALFPLKDEPNTYFAAWTTTPWTLLGNVALALGPDVDYIKAEANEKRYWFAKDRLSILEDAVGEVTILEEKKGNDLVGIPYIPLWDFFSHLPEKQHYTIADNYVTTDDGSGIVHLALYGEDDYRIIRQNNFPMIQHVNERGLFVKECGVYAGRFFKEEQMDVEIIKDLAKRDQLLLKEKYEHNYPFCYRHGTPLMYFLRPCWYLKTTAFADEMIKANQQINWYPDHIKEGRFGKWLENNVDWAVSRERYWGSPMPVWECSNPQCTHQICVESIAELNKYATQPIAEDADLHKPFIDEVICRCPECTGEMKRVPEVLDCWYNAGLMPWGQHGYPSKKGSERVFEDQFPADFICEAMDQTRGWFYTLLAVSTLLTGQSSFKNVICTGHVLDAEGRKMSKSLGNVIDPIDMCHKYGAEAVRWLFFNVTPGNNVNFSEPTIKDMIRLTLLPLWNCYSFFVTYANIDHWKPDGTNPKLHNPLDQWIQSETHTLTKKVTEALDRYDSVTATDTISEFLDKLSNWYVRRSRRRFWKSENDTDKNEAYYTLYTTLEQIIRLLAPFLPFITESMYQNIIKPNLQDAPVSVHLMNYPKAVSSLINPALEERMNRVRKVVSMGNALRKASKIKNRQPLSEIIIVYTTQEEKKTYETMDSLILDELNIKKLILTDQVTELVNLKGKANFRALGPRFGKQVNAVAKSIAGLEFSDLLSLFDGKPIMIELNGESKELTPDDVQILREEKEGLLVQTDEATTVALNIELNDALMREGFAREFVNKVQTMRKNQDLDVLANIHITYASSERIQESIHEFEDYIKTETLAHEIQHTTTLSEGESWDLNGEQTYIVIQEISK